jgi:Zn-dependent M28 family amino/carboxypeptidase
MATAGLLAAGLAAPAGAGEIETIADGEGVPAVRYAGDTRYDTSALIATDDSPTGASHESDQVILARGDAFPDGLAGSLLSGSVDAPVLLTETNAVPQTTMDAIEELTPTTIHLLGGEVAISAAVEAQLEGEGYTVERISGPTRYHTAAEIASIATADDVDTAIVASGENFPDALVAGPISAVGGLPLLLSQRDTLPEVTAGALEDLGISTVLLAGGTVAISAEVQAELEGMGLEVERVRGGTRYETALAFADWGVDNLGFVTSHVNLATGEKFPDALSLAAHAAADYPGPSPIVLTPTATLATSTEAWLRDHATADNTAIHVGGGTAAIEDGVVDAARAAFSPAGWTTPEMFADGVMVDRATDHLQALQDIADANGDTRASSTPGYDASIDYVKGLLDDAGYVTEVQDFDFDYYEELSDPTFSQTGGDDAPQDFLLATGPDDTADTDFAAMSYTGTATITDEPIEAVDLSIDTPDDSTSGCEASDFDSFTAGNVALVQRGACTFNAKASNAFAAGAVGVIIFNQGNGGADRTDVFFGTLGGPVDEDGTPGADGPVISASFDVGVALAADDETGDDVTVSISTESLNEARSSSNLLAETPGGDPDNVVMAGAHLDSVPEGPGIQDNGTGSAAILETALQLARSGAPVANKVRFAWWGAEENGLVGSTYYVDNVLINESFTALTPEGEAVALYLNFDMVGSPNFARFIYDGDGDTFGIGDPGSAVIESGFEDVFDAAGLAHEPTAFSGRSDYAEFQVAGIPAGGLFTGAEGIKTAEQEDLYGGTAGEAYDACYHQACDTIDNVNTEVFGQMLSAIGQEVYTYALSTAEVDAAVAGTDGGARAPATVEAHATADAHHHGGEAR